MFATSAAIVLVMSLAHLLFAHPRHDEGPIDLDNVPVDPVSGDLSELAASLPPVMFTLVSSSSSSSSSPVTSSATSRGPSKRAGWAPSEIRMDELVNKLRSHLYRSRKKHSYADAEPLKKRTSSYGYRVSLDNDDGDDDDDVIDKHPFEASVDLRHDADADDDKQSVADWTRLPSGSLRVHRGCKPGKKADSRRQQFLPAVVRDGTEVSRMKFIVDNLIRPAKHGNGSKHYNGVDRG